MSLITLAYKNWKGLLTTKTKLLSAKTKWQWGIMCKKCPCKKGPSTTEVWLCFPKRIYSLCATGDKYRGLLSNQGEGAIRAWSPSSPFLDQRIKLLLHWAHSCYTGVNGTGQKDLGLSPGLSTASDSSASLLEILHFS